MPGCLGGPTPGADRAKLVEGERRQPTGGFRGKPKTPLGASDGVSEDPERIIGRGNHAAGEVSPEGFGGR
jgi:hypothetical protein